MTYTVGQRKQQINQSTGLQETLEIVSIVADEFGGIVIHWVKVG